MLHFPLEHIADGFEAAMGVRWKTANIIAWFIGAKLIQHQEGIESRQVTPTEDTFKLHAVPVAGAACAENFFDTSEFD